MGNLHAVVSLLLLTAEARFARHFEVASGRCVGLWVIGFLRFTGRTGCCSCCGAQWSCICLSHVRKRLFFFALVSRAVGMKDGLGLVVLR